MSETKTTFPTEPDKDGFFYESEDEKDMSIETKVYENGNQVKRTYLKDKKEVIIRQLKGADMIQLKRQIQSFKEGEIDIDTLAMSRATKIDGKELVPEDYLAMDMPDFNRLLATSNILNFQ